MANDVSAGRLCGVAEECVRGRLDLVRDDDRNVVDLGNPFQPVSLNPSWTSPTVIALAHAIYEERSLPQGTLDSDRMVALADALEEVGCREPAILEHCRSAGEHVRGCFVVDLILDKE